MSTLVSIRARLREFYEGQNIAPMLHRSHTLARRGRVNLLKKVKVDGVWRFFPAVVESDGRWALNVGASAAPYAKPAAAPGALDSGGRLR